MIKHDHHIDEIFMRRALELAELGRGSVSPNPLVGSVIVHDSKIIGEGWHKKFGEPHAEVNAVNAVNDKSLLRKSTLYVNLEPCSHTGKTPPCADMLIANGIQKVVIANLDSNPLVSGDGVRKLRSSGIEVTSGILDKAGHELNKRFFTFMEKQRPYIVLKWAETADGFIARENYDSKWISNEYSRQIAHKWRSEEDAILVGAKTAAHDNPQLNVRDWSGRDPVRIVLDRFLRLDKKLNVFDKKQKTILYNVLKHEEHSNLILARVEDEDFISNVVTDLFKRNIQSLLVEGGATTLNLFIEHNLWDEARIFQSPRLFEKGIAGPTIRGKLHESHSIQSDALRIIYNAL
jgi:diaminohydroxyphosphoribosylaminopyrimidine deaminase/5-amino-6-(5-phosphoribosylamino)uracil reductase